MTDPTPRQPPAVDANVLIKRLVEENAQMRLDLAVKDLQIEQLLAAQPEPESRS